MYLSSLARLNGSLTILSAGKDNIKELFVAQYKRQGRCFFSSLLQGSMSPSSSSRQPNRAYWSSTLGDYSSNSHSMLLDIVLMDKKVIDKTNKQTNKQSKQKKREEKKAPNTSHW